MQHPRAIHWTAASVLVLFAQCTVPASDELLPGSESHPLIGGTIDNEDEWAVSLTDGTFSFCTGTLISPSVVATAAHCIDEAGASPNFTVFFGTDVNEDGRRVEVSRSQANPGWTGELSHNDIGLLLLSFPQDPTLPVPLNTSPISQHIGDPIRRIGFGIYDNVTQESDGRKRTGMATITGTPTGTDVFVGGDDEVATCSGDSGGPALLTIDEVEYLAGVHSFGFEGCPINSDQGDTRVDLHLDFVRDWIEDNDPACKSNGVCARIGCASDPDCEPCGADGTCATDCPLPDVDCPTQDLGEICRADTQCMSGFCIYWRGDPKTKFCSQECAGDSDCPNSMSCQSFSTFGNVCYYDEDPPGVVGDPCTEATECGSYLCDENQCVTECDLSIGLVCREGFECRSSNDSDYYCHTLPVADEGGGLCSIEDGGDSRGLWWALVGLVLIRRKRRGRHHGNSKKLA